MHRFEQNKKEASPLEFPEHVCSNNHAATLRCQGAKCSLLKYSIDLCYNWLFDQCKDADCDHEHAVALQGIEIKNKKVKTSMCRHYLKPQGCKYGDQCQFAHGFAEMRDGIDFHQQICEDVDEGPPPLKDLEDDDPLRGGAAPPLRGSPMALRFNCRQRVAALPNLSALPLSAGHKKLHVAGHQSKVVAPFLSQLPKMQNAACQTDPNLEKFDWLHFEDKDKLAELVIILGEIGIDTKKQLEEFFLDKDMKEYLTDEGMAYILSRFNPLQLAKLLRLLPLSEDQRKEYLCQNLVMRGLRAH